MKSIDIRLTDKEKRIQVLLCLDYKVLKVIVQGKFYFKIPLRFPAGAIVTIYFFFTFLL